MKSIEPYLLCVLHARSHIFRLLVYPIGVRHKIAKQDTVMTLSNHFSVFDKLCDMCKHFQCSCRISLTTESINISSLPFEECIATDLNISENSKIIISENTSSILPRTRSIILQKKSVYNNIDDSNIHILMSYINIRKCRHMQLTVGTKTSMMILKDSSFQRFLFRQTDFNELHDDSKRQLIPKISLPSNRF